MADQPTSTSCRHFDRLLMPYYLTIPTAKQVIAFGHDTLLNMHRFGGRCLRIPRRPITCLDDCGSAHSCAFIDRETRDGLSRKGRVLNGPGRPTVARLQDSRATAGVADQGRRAGNGREAGDTRGRRCVGPGGTVVVRHDDGGNVPTVVADGDTCGRERGAGDGADVRQWWVARCGVPRRRRARRGRWRELACDDSGQGRLNTVASAATATPRTVRTLTSLPGQEPS